jgi:hypothetical protein
MTSSYGDTESRSRRSVLTDYIDVFAESDVVALESGKSVTRVAIEGELRSFSVSVDQIVNNYSTQLRTAEPVKKGFFARLFHK